MTAPPFAWTARTPTYASSRLRSTSAISTASLSFYLDQLGFQLIFDAPRSTLAVVFVTVAPPDGHREPHPSSPPEPGSEQYKLIGQPTHVHLCN